MDDRTSSAFADACAFFVDTVSVVTNDRWEQPGLGEWTVRQSVAHTNRAQTTFVMYINKPPQPEPRGSGYFSSDAILPEAAKRLSLSVPTPFEPSKPPPSQRSS